MATVAGPKDHDSFDVSDVDSNPLGMYYMKLYYNPLENILIISL